MEGIPFVFGTSQLLGKVAACRAGTFAQFCQIGEVGAIRTTARPLIIVDYADIAAKKHRLSRTTELVFLNRAPRLARQKSRDDQTGNRVRLPNVEGEM
jgi:hypothetical protein